MRRPPLAEAGAVVSVIVAVMLVAGFAWRQLPADHRATRARAMVVSRAFGFPTRSGTPAYVVLTLRRDGVAEPVVLKRTVACLPPFKPGDSVQLVGVHSNGGAMLWGIVGEPCPD